MFEKSQLWTNNGLPRTNSLFVEVSRPGDKPIMSLNGVNEDFPCLRDLYVAYVVDDPSEVVFAETVFNDVRYWLKLKSAAFMPKYLEEWDEIVQVKRKQKAFAAVFDEIESKGRSAFTAAKYLIEEQWRKDKNTKTAKQKASNTSKQALGLFSEDLERLREDGIIQ